MKKNILLLFVFILKFYPQTCGFGCLGLSGIFVGYSQQSYDFNDFNTVLSEKYMAGLSKDSKIDFHAGSGLRIGTNIFRAKFSKMFITAKGYYQYSKEDYTFNSISGNETIKMDANFNHWGLGIDFGTKLFGIFDLKIIDGGITLYQSDFSLQTNSNNEEIDIKKYESTKNDFGFYLGSGLIIHIIPDYVSVEGSIFYNYIKINNLADEEGNLFISQGSSANIIRKGGLTSVVQINIGIPL